MGFFSVPEARVEKRLGTLVMNWYEVEPKGYEIGADAAQQHCSSVDELNITNTAEEC